MSSVADSESHLMTGDHDSLAQPRPPVVRAIVFMVAGLPLRIVQFVLLVTGTLTGLAMTIVWIGLPILYGTTQLVRAFGDLERQWVTTMLHTPVPAAERLPVDGNVARRWRIQLVDSTTWRDLGYLLLMFPLGIVEFVVGVIGIVLLPIAIWIVPGLGWLHGQLAQSMLGPDQAGRMRRRAQNLQASRARGVDAAEAERRRIERDLHDGAQQRLVSVAMGLGRVQAKLDDDPDGARELVNEAHGEAKLAVTELRDLARGIYPAVLGDRGLDAALSAQAAASPVPVEVSVEDSVSDPRPPGAVETCAHFIVAEALTNIAKHADATEAQVRVWRTGNRKGTADTGDPADMGKTEDMGGRDDTVIVEVTDNGVGGAELHPGGGLAGLADRAATIDGVVTVESPTAGPTVLRAELPCTW